MTRLAVTARFDDGGGDHRGGEKASIAGREVLFPTKGPPDWLPTAIPTVSTLPARSAASKSGRARRARTEVGVSPETLRVLGDPVGMRGFFPSLLVPLAANTGRKLRQFSCAVCVREGGRRWRRTGSYVANAMIASRVGGGSKRSPDALAALTGTLDDPRCSLAG